MCLVRPVLALLRASAALRRAYPPKQHEPLRAVNAAPVLLGPLGQRLFFLAVLRLDLLLLLNDRPSSRGRWRGIPRSLCRENNRMGLMGLMGHMGPIDLLVPYVP